MKVRLDFVTNSSSSSFVFGEAGKDTGVTGQKVLDYAVGCCDLLLNAVADMNNAFSLSKHKDQLLLMRKLEKQVDVLHEEASGYGLSIEHVEELLEAIDKIYDITYDLYERLVETVVYKRTIKDIYNKYHFNDYYAYANDFAVGFMDLYEEVGQINWLKELRNKGLKEHIVDFRMPVGKNMGDFVYEMIGWYSWTGDESLKDKQGTEEYKYVHNDYIMEEDISKHLDLAAISLNQIGEVALLGYYSGSLPGILNHMLAIKASRYSTHMG